jgi:hypothetical protein
LAVWSVCLSDPEQADVPPNALWVATESPRLTASIQPRPQSRGTAAENQSVTASHRQSEAVRGDFLRLLTLASLGIAMSVSPSRIAGGIRVRTIFPWVGIDGTAETE